MEELEREEGEREEREEREEGLGEGEQCPTKQESYLVMMVKRRAGRRRGRGRGHLSPLH